MCGGVGPRGNQGENNMERRKFLIGAAGAAVGSSALVGSGAMDVIRADRRFEVDVVGDQEAYLMLDANDDSQFVTQSNPIGFDFASSSGEGGSGVNNDGTTAVKPGFTIKNQSSETMYIEIENPASNSNLSGGGVDVQFLANDSGKTSNWGAESSVLFDRNTPVEDLSGNSDNTNPATMKRNEDSNPSWGGYLGFVGSKRGKGKNDEPQYIQLNPGSAIDVVVRIIANNAEEYSFDGNVEIRALSDESSTYISEGPSEYVGDGGAEEQQAE